MTQLDQMTRLRLTAQMDAVNHRIRAISLEATKTGVHVKWITERQLNLPQWDRFGDLLRLPGWRWDTRND